MVAPRVATGVPGLAGAVGVVVGAGTGVDAEQVGSPKSRRFEVRVSVY